MRRKIIKTSGQAGRSSGAAAGGFREVHAALLKLANPEKATFLRGFFKTGKGQYAEGDRFLGIMVPAIRQLARRFRELGLADCERLLQSPYNEERLVSLLILVDCYRKADAEVKDGVYQMFLKNRHRVNNWNLVDSSAPYIIGVHLLRQDRSVLYELMDSASLWDRRMAMVATFAFIREGDFADGLRLAELLLGDDHDLMHKACGWMLREIGKRDQVVLEGFLRQHHSNMPRTMLRYAIERFPPAKRRDYLSGRIK
ncbi:MAG: alkylation repair enzyme [Pedosphaera sp.]|nr:alkylation repair enzyme [Pedosphaera sp.]